MTRWRFQYPLADRLGFWGSPPDRVTGTQSRFSILWRIDLVFGVIPDCIAQCKSQSFSILWRIDLVFGDNEIAERTASS